MLAYENMMKDHQKLNQHLIYTFYIAFPRPLKP